MSPESIPDPIPVGDTGTNLGLGLIIKSGESGIAKDKLGLSKLFSGIINLGELVFMFSFLVEVISIIGALVLNPSDSGTKLESVK